MPTIHFVEIGTDAEYVVEAASGQTVMEVATENFVPGIVGECGGACSCATCHAYIDQPWFERLEPLDEMEEMMLEGAVEPGPQSRLCCQIKITEELDGLIARIPAGQL